jgi:hypothetical protein
MRTGSILASVLTLAWLVSGCNSGGPAKHGEEGHSHERGKMLLAEAGKYHAALTAHLSSKEGNELDIFFETTGNPPKPVPLPLEFFFAKATTTDKMEHELKFEPADFIERKDDPPGQCSHFVAKAWWMKPEDKLDVEVKIPIDGKDVTIRWDDFNPKKYGSEHDHADK